MKYTFQAPDGKKYTVEGDHEPNQEEMAGIAASHSSGPAPSPSGGSFLDDVGAAGRNRFEKAGNAVEGTGPLGKVLHGAAQAGGFLGDVGMATLKHGLYEPVTGAMSALQPDALTNLARPGVLAAEETAANVAAPVVGAVAEKYGEMKQAHPLGMQRLEDVANIASSLPIGKMAGMAAKGGELIASEGMGMAGRGLEKASEKITPALAKLSLKEGPLATEAMTTGSSKAGRAAMAATTGREADIGKDLLKNLSGDNFNDQLLGNNLEIRSALDEMPNIKLDNTIKALENSKIKGKGVSELPNSKKANAKIDEYINALKSATATEPTISPNEFFKIRQHLDSDIPWDAPEKKMVDNALLNARKVMAKDLVDEAPDVYRASMEDMATKLQARDAILDDIPGKSIVDKMDHVESYIKNIHGLGKANKQEALKTLDAVFGTDYYGQSRNAALGKQFGEEGVPGFLTQHKTGYGATQLMGAGGAVAALGSGNIGPALGGVGMAALQSPLVNTRIIGGMRGAGKGLQWAGKAIDPLKDIAKMRFNR